MVCAKHVGGGRPHPSEAEAGPDRKARRDHQNRETRELYPQGVIGEPMQVMERKPIDEDGGDNRSQTPEPSAARRLTLPPRLARAVYRSRNPRHDDDPPADPDRDVSHDPMVAAACRLTHRQSLRRRSRPLPVNPFDAGLRPSGGASLRRMRARGARHRTNDRLAKAAGDRSASPVSMRCCASCDEHVVSARG